MSTRRPNVPRANRSARPTGPAGGSGADRAGNTPGSAAGGAVGGSGKRVTTNDDVISAEVLHPDFGWNGQDKPDERTPEDDASSDASPATHASTDTTSNGTAKKAPGKVGNKKERSPGKAARTTSSASDSGSASGAVSGTASGSNSGSKPGSKTGGKKRLSASARRASERDSAKYAVRQPVVSWTRPGDAGHLGTASGAAGEPVPAKSFSGRLLALAVVLIAMIIILAPTVQTYVEQRMEINALQQDIAAQQAEQERLQTQLSRWEDPAYIKQQARERLFLVMPGETRYLVVGADEAKEPEQIPASPTGDEDVPWVDALFESIKRSGTD